MSDPVPALTRRVENYIKYRPRYPQAVLRAVTTHCRLTPRHLIADIGSGTGILAELFLQNGNRVIGVEPDDDMREGAIYALRSYPEYIAMKATAEATSLPDQGVDFITAGQAFHWFDPERTQREFKRILAPDGWVVLVWNIQRKAGTPFMEALEAYWNDPRFWSADRKQTFGAEAYKGGYDRIREEILIPFFKEGTFREHLFENPLIVNLEGLIGRIFSTIPALREDEDRYKEMLDALREMFEAHQQGGHVIIEHDVRLVYGQL